MRVRNILLVSAAALGGFVCGFLASSSARAADCSVAKTQTEMNECADKSYRATDAELNDLYKEIETRLSADADTAKRLVTAQRAWIALRDAECDFATAAVEGSARPAALFQCAERITNQRITDFRAYLKCEEGDLACPVPSPTKK